MKTLPIPASFFALLSLGLAVSTLNAQPAPLGLLRLQPATRPGQAAALAPGRYAVDELAAGAAAGAGRIRQNDVDLLAVAPGGEWSRPLRGPGWDTIFVSFQLYASAGTLVDLGGVRLGITLSPAGGNLQLMYDDSTGGTLQWKPLNVHIGAGRYGGKTFAALPTLTVRLDPGSNTWDLYSGSRLIADNLPIIAARKEQRTFSVRAGSEGAWLAGLVQADDNPLYVDANANGIDDDFERQTRGGLLAATASPADRQALAQDWKTAQRQKPPPALYVKRPLPDRVAVVAPRR